MKINIHLWLTFLLLTGLIHSTQAFEIDWDGSIGEGEHSYVPAISNPLFNETPYITTEVRPIFAYHEIPDDNLLGPGDVKVYAVEARVALTDNFGIIATKDGYGDFDFSSQANALGISDTNGWFNIAIGAKYALWNDVEDESILTVGLKYEAPTGNIEISSIGLDLNGGSSDGFINGFVTGAKRFDRLGLQASAGVNAALDGDHDSSMIHYSLHADYALTDRLFPMIEYNGFTVYDDGNRTSLGFEGTDVVNIGCSNCGTVMTVAGGLRYRATDHILLGAGYEKSVKRDDIFDWRTYVDVIVHF